MSEPEIARRCPQCGASIRERAFFCPQCGRPLLQNEEDEPEALSAVRASEVDASEQARATTNKAKTDSSSDLDDEPGTHSSERGVHGSERGVQGSERGAHPTRDRIHRATTRARDVIEEDVMPSVQRIRKISTEVLDEAAYDPSLRFVLIAGALFLLFLLLLLLSKWVG